MTETAANFIARCVERAPSGWSAGNAIANAMVIPDDGSNPMGQIICARGGVYLAVQGYPSRRDDDGIEFWDNPSSWELFLSREEQRGELAAAAIGANGADELAERSEWE